MSGYRRIRIANDLVVGWFENGCGFVEAEVMEHGLPSDAKLVKAQVVIFVFELELTFFSESWDSVPGTPPLITPLYATPSKGSSAAIPMPRKRQIVLDGETDGI